MAAKPERVGVMRIFVSPPSDDMLERADHVVRHGSQTFFIPHEFFRRTKAGQSTIGCSVSRCRGAFGASDRDEMPANRNETLLASYVSSFFRHRSPHE
jgi:hypothetical protein